MPSLEAEPLHGADALVTLPAMDISREPRWLDSGQQQAWRGLVVGMTLLIDRLDDELQRAFDLSLTEYEILVRLSERPERSLRMAHLADALAHSRSRVTHTVARMERAGWVQRGTTPEDGRGVVCTMTDAGWDLLVRAAPLHVEGVRRHLVDLADPDDFAALGRAMNAVADHLVSAHPAVDLR